tara:strand:+ start:180 stop:323 length:144 start_codon:yes stop_codon:yes gene_type:complete
LLLLLKLRNNVTRLRALGNRTPLVIIADFKKNKDKKDKFNKIKKEFS